MVISIIFDSPKRDSSNTKNKILCFQFPSVSFLVVYIHTSCKSFSFQCQWSF